MRAFAHRGLGIAITALLALPVMAQAPRRPAAAATAQSSGELMGLVTDAGGRPQAGAVVQVRSGGVHGILVHGVTTAAGVFSFTGLVPGIYYVQVGKGARLAARQRVQVHASERALLLVNLPKVLESARFGPPAGEPADHAFDWALRQATIWKPILRLQDPQAAEAPAGGGPPLEGYVALTAGAGTGAFQGPDLATAFRFDTRLLNEQVSFVGDVGTNGQGGGSDTRLEARLRPIDPSNSSRLMMAMRQVSVPGLPALPSLRVLSLNYANGVAVGDNLRVQYGAMVNAVTMTDTVATFDPYLRVMYRVGQTGVLEYRAVSAVPPVRFNRDYADMPDPTPQVTLDHNRARLERAHHQELMYTDSFTPNDTVSAAVFTEHFSRAAVNGTFSIQGGGRPGMSGAEMEAGNLLPDLLNNMFTADGGSYGGVGYRVVLQHRLGANWRADLGFSDGAVLVPNGATFDRNMADALRPGRAHAITAKISGITPFTHTNLICSYRALSGPMATELDPYDDGAGQSEGYANVYIRQPLPAIMGGSSGRLAALLEIHNLLAQGYIPMMGSDGHTLYLVQSARSLRGGLTISF